MKVWTTLTGVDDVALYTDRDEAIRDLVQFIKDAGYDDEVEVNASNWQEALKALNSEMDEMGEAHYNATLTEHVLPTPKVVVEMDGDAVHRIHTDSPLLDGVEAVVLSAQFDPADAGDSVVEVPLGGGAPAEFAASTTAIEVAKDWDVATAYEAVENLSSSRGMSR